MVGCSKLVQNPACSLLFCCKCLSLNVLRCPATYCGLAGALQGLDCPSAKILAIRLYRRRRERSMARVRSAQHPRRFCGHPDACPACFCSPSWSSGAWRREELYVAKGSSGRDGVCDRRGSSGFPPAETGWDLYLPNLERARARQGSVLQPCSLSTRTCGRALTFPEVDSSSALTNGPRFKYTLPWQLFCSKRPLRLAESRSCQLDQLLSHRLKAHARNVPPVRPASADPCAGRFLGLEMILKRSTTKSTALAFVRQLFPTHFALILRYHHPHEAAIIFDFGIKNLHRARSLENTAAKDFSLRGLFILRRPPLEVSPPRNNFPKFTTKSTALAFVRQAVPTHSAFIFRGDNKPEAALPLENSTGRFQGDQPVKQNVRLLAIDATRLFPSNRSRHNTGFLGASGVRQRLGTLHYAMCRAQLFIGWGSGTDRTQYTACIGVQRRTISNCNGPGLNAAIKRRERVYELQYTDVGPQIGHVDFCECVKPSLTHEGLLRGFESCAAEGSGVVGSGVGSGVVNGLVTDWRLTPAKREHGCGRGCERGQSRGLEGERGCRQGYERGFQWRQRDWFGVPIEKNVSQQGWKDLRRGRGAKLAGSVCGGDRGGKFGMHDDDEETMRRRQEYITSGITKDFRVFLAGPIVAKRTH
ncbi:hypothetical protein DFH06DRAFT_1127500 [Mycena polygramma]|nr:hypothetical protein DFH06DRAFT_1127500 [Mycena polygramma]